MSPFVSNTTSDSRARSGFVNLNRVFGKKMADRDSKKRKRERREKTWSSSQQAEDNAHAMTTETYATHRWEEDVDVDAIHEDENEYRYASPVRVRAQPKACPLAPIRPPSRSLWLKPDAHPPPPPAPLRRFRSVWLNHEPRSVGSTYVKDHLRLWQAEGIVDADGNHVPTNTPNKLKRSFAAVLREDSSGSPIKSLKLDDLVI